MPTSGTDTPLIWKEGHIVTITIKPLETTNHLPLRDPRQQQQWLLRTFQHLS